MNTLNRKILVVDDNEDLASVLQLMLQTEGYEARVAKDGGDGYSAYLLFRPDLVITDIQMPIKNGLELMKQIRTHNPNVKTIYMSGDMSPFWTSLKLEQKDYPVALLEKPFSKFELMKVLFQFLGNEGEESTPAFLNVTSPEKKLQANSGIV